MNRHLTLLIVWICASGAPGVSAAEKTIEGMDDFTWQPTPISATIGDVIQWKINRGEHGVRITNWAVVKDHVEIETVADQQPFNATTGRNDEATTSPGKLLLRLRIKSIPPSPPEITYNCIRHGSSMSGTVALALGQQPDAVSPRNTRADPLPNVVLKTQDNREVRFYDDLIKDKIVIINLMYTTCEGICLRGTKNLLEVQKSLGNRLGREVYMYSITTDPVNDTPAALKAYAERNGVKPGWTFLTGTAENIATVREKLGLSNPDPNWRSNLGLPDSGATDTADPKKHSGMILIGHDAFNKWTKKSTLAAPDQILQEIERMKPPAAVAAEARTLAAEKLIDATGDNAWQPNDISAAVGDTVQWKLGAGSHGVRITNWAAVKEHVEVEMVPGQQPFNTTTGRNDQPTSAAGQVLLRLKIRSIPPAAIQYNCIVHGGTMSGKVTVTAP